MPYAAQTRVPIFKTKTDIYELLAKQGDAGFAYATDGDHRTNHDANIAVLPSAC